MNADQNNGNSRRRKRVNRRKLNHDETSVEPFRPVRVPKHPLIPDSEPQFITTDSCVADLIDHAREIGTCCYDTEFIGESFYHPRLCLLQIATTGRVAVIDVLSGVNTDPIWDLLANASVRKIVHAGQQDLEPVIRHTRRRPANIFDTQIAAGFAGLPYPLSLTRLTHALLNVKLGKRLTFTSWDHRPLSKAHLHYAADDVRFGPALASQLMERLDRLGRTEWAMQECDRLCNPERYETDMADVALKMRGAKGLNRPQGASLYELALLRDELARMHDQPPRSVIRDDVLVDLARRAPTSVEALEDIRGLPRPIKSDHGEKLISAIQTGRQKGNPPWPRMKNQEESPELQVQVDSLWSAVQTYCRSLSIDPSLLANRAEMFLAFQAAQGQCEWPQSLCEGWRAQSVRRFIEQFIELGESLSVCWRENRLCEDTHSVSTASSE